MSTRSTTKFGWGPPTTVERPGALVYRHPDGYPSSMIPDLYDFFRTVENETNDHRFDDPSYLAAKWVVFLARMFSSSWNFSTGEKDLSKVGSLDFISVGVMMQDPGDIEYSYWVDCSDPDADGFPLVYINCLDDEGWLPVHEGWEEPEEDF